MAWSIVRFRRSSTISFIQRLVEVHDRGILGVYFEESVGLEGRENQVILYV